MYGTEKCFYNEVSIYTKVGEIIVILSAIHSTLVIVIFVNEFDLKMSGVIVVLVC